MKKDPHPFCYLLVNNGLVPVTLQNNQLIQANNNGKKGSRPINVFLNLTKQLTFSISRFEMLQNEEQKFSIQIKTKENSTSSVLIVYSKQDLDFFIKNLSQYGMGVNLSELVVQCQKIGQGSFAEVYKVVTNYDTTIAFKAFQKKSLKISKNKLAFQNEIDIMRSLNSKFIATVDGLFQTQKNIYMKMEFFPNSLKYYCKRNLSIKTQKRIMGQILQALIEMKSKNIIHRDLKPENIMIRGKNQKQLECVLIDFGLATLAKVDNYIYNRCGTPGFLAPQIAKMTSTKERLTPACDIFSLGCIFYKILTKKYIFAAENYDQVVEKNKAVDIPWESFDNFSDNGKIQFIFVEKDLLKKMLQKDPMKRITPQQALNHPYFVNDVDDEDQIPVEGCDLRRKMRTITIVSLKSRKHTIQSIMSSFNSNSSSNAESSLNDTCTNDQIHGQCRIKDSCLSFDGPVKGSDSDTENVDFALEMVYKVSQMTQKISRFSKLNNKSL